METIVYSKEKFVIPPEILMQLGVKDKSFLQIDVNKTGQIVLTPLRGKYKGKGLMKALMTARKRERQ